MASEEGANKQEDRRKEGEPISMSISEAQTPISSHPTVDPISLNLFEGVSAGATDTETAVSLTPRYSVFKKLEVVNARKINVMAKLFNIASFCALVVSAAAILLARFAFSEVFRELPGVRQGSTIDITVYNFPRAFTLIDSILSLTVFIVAVLVFLGFGVVLVKQGRARVLNEQVWVLMLLGGTALYLNPHEAIVRLRRDYLGQDVPETEDGFSYVDVFTCIRMLSFSVIGVLYLWMGSHSYRYLRKRISYRNWQFYVFKIAVVVIYNTYKLIVLFRYRIVFAELPFATLIAFLYLYSSLRTWPKLGVATVSALTGLEAILLALIVFDIVETRRAHNSVEYVKHRTKIVGFRFFLHQHIIFYGVYSITYLLILFGLPNGQQLLQFVILAPDGDGRGSYFDVQYAPFGLQLCILVYAITEAYTNLPASFSFTRWLSSSRWEPLHKWDATEPVVYRNREPISFDDKDVRIQPNCFIMQTNVQLFNLAWFVYYKGTRKEKSIDIDLNRSSLTIVDSMYHKETDTRAIVAASPDRIVIAFKGTSSSQNLVTDIKVIHRSLSQVISRDGTSSLRNEDNTLVNSLQTSKPFKKAKVHAGFAEAYNSVKEKILKVTSGLLKEKNRTVYCTGHSLGGALATLCSFDIASSLLVPSRKLVVSTFGSPRVGNKFFQQIYDQVVPMHWRVVAGGDIIARLPKIGYEHVGKKVILTAGGDLFIDPNTLDMLFWDSQPASIVHHRKSCYLLALKSWCDGRNTDYVPNFWPFPISANDSRKFDIAFRKPDSKGPGTFDRLQGKSSRARKYKLWAEVINELDTPIHSEEAIRLWTRLTTSLLDQERNRRK